MHNVVFSGVFSLFLTNSALSQVHRDSADKANSGFFKTSRYCQPFVSEVENYRTQAGLLLASNSEEYDVSNSRKTYKVFQYTTAGTEIPIYRKLRSLNGKAHDAFAFSSALAFHLFWDPFEPYTSPIITTDYRIAAISFKYIRFLEYNKIKNLSFKFTPYNHESTHIGDDLTLYRLGKKYPITRVNVSYEYCEFVFTVNDPNGSQEQNHSFRFGWQYRINGTDDYYIVYENEGDPSLVHPTGIKSEYYLQYNFLRTKGPLTWNKWKNILSFELRNRAQYQYPEFSTRNGYMENLPLGPSRAFTFNLYVGYRYAKIHGPSLGIYLHAYSGILPYGQFRNQADFKSIGLSLVLE